MLGNIIGIFFESAHNESNLFMLNPEYKSNSLRGKDLGVNVFTNAPETAKGNHLNLVGYTVRTFDIK